MQLKQTQSKNLKETMRFAADKNIYSYICHIEISIIVINYL